MAKISENSPLAMELEFLKFQLKEPVEPLPMPEKSDSTPQAGPINLPPAPDFEPAPGVTIHRTDLEENIEREKLINQMLRNQAKRRKNG